MFRDDPQAGGPGGATRSRDGAAGSNTGGPGGTGQRRGRREIMQDIDELTGEARALFREVLRLHAELLELRLKLVGRRPDADADLTRV